MLQYLKKNYLWRSYFLKISQKTKHEVALTWLFLFSPFVQLSFKQKTRNLVAILKVVFFMTV